MKKYELVTDMSISVLGRKLFRIRALVDFTTKWGETIHTGDLGGYLEKEENLSHDGDAWVYGNAKVYGNAEVCGNALVYGNAKVCDNAKVFGDAKVCGNAEVCGDAKVFGNAKVFGDAKVFGNAKVCGDAKVYGNAEVCGKNHILTVGPIGSRNATTNFFRDKNGEISVVCDCFYENIDDFLEKVKKTHGNNKHAKA